MTGLAVDIVWDRLRPGDSGPCMAVGCTEQRVVAAVVIEGRRFRLCADDAADITEQENTSA